MEVRRGEGPAYLVYRMAAHSGQSYVNTSFSTFQCVYMDSLKTCTKCGTPLPIDQFYKRNKDGALLPACKKCHNERGEDWRRRNRAKANAAQRRRWVKKKYGVGPDLWEAMFTIGCALCREPFELQPKRLETDKRQLGGKNPVIDHDHKTGVVRGMLHSKCNSALGLLDDNPERAKQAYEYLLKSTKPA